MLSNYELYELTFDNHRTVLDPQNAYLQPGNWPYLTDKYYEQFLMNIDYGIKPPKEEED